MSPSGKDESSRKPAGSRPPEPVLKCPRCDSPNTKFCYYNNYSLTQPRHFCKTCRRYWTKGGALRNVPIGGGCRKNKKVKSSPRPIADASIGPSDVGGLKFFQGVSPAMDFQVAFPPRIPPAGSGGSGFINHLVPLGNSPNSCDQIPANPNFQFLDPNFINPSSSSLINFANFPISSGMNQEMGSLNVHSTLASSIESLSSINQDLHWKLQQQRLGMIPAEHQLVMNQKPQPIVFDISKQDMKKDQPLSTEWFFDSSMAAGNPTAGTSSSAGNNWTGIQGWNAADLGPFTASSLP